MEYIDAHVHLQDERFDSVREEMIAQCIAGDYRALWVNGTCPSDWQQVSLLCSKHSLLKPFYGVHPWFISDLPASWRDDLRALVAGGECGIGEIGLDLYKDGLDPQLQEEVFRYQLDLAKEYQRPVCIHCLKAWDWFMQVMGGYGYFEPGFIVHSFGGSAQAMCRLVGLNGYISFSASVIKSSKLQQVCREVPAGRLLLETDAPDMLLPKSMGQQLEIEGVGRINSVLNLPLIYEFVAGVRECGISELCAQVLENATVLYRNAVL